MDIKQKRTASASRARSGARTRSGTATAQRGGKTAAKRKPQKRRATPDVVYTPPKPFNRSHLLLGLATAVGVVLALVFSMTIFFKVENVIVSGTEKYSAWTVMEASGIEVGDSLLGISDARAASKIQAALPYADDVRVSIKLPDTVNIEIKELDVWYAVRDVYDAWWVITAEGRVVEQVDAATAGDCTKILGIQLSAPAPGNQAVAAEAAASVDEEGNTLPVTSYNSERLSTALSILQYLESNEIIGSVVSVDVSDLLQLELWYGQQYQVELGDASQLSYKIECMKKVVDLLPEYETGIIDVSFNTITDQPIYQGFDS